MVSRPNRLPHMTAEDVLMHASQLTSELGNRMVHIAEPYCAESLRKLTIAVIGFAVGKQCMVAMDYAKFKGRPVKDDVDRDVDEIMHMAHAYCVGHGLEGGLMVPDGTRDVWLTVEEGRFLSDLLKGMWEGHQRYKPTSEDERLEQAESEKVMAAVMGKLSSLMGRIENDLP